MVSGLGSMSHKVWTDKHAHDQPAYEDTHMEEDRYSWARGRKVDPTRDVVEVKAAGGCLGMC